jgi:hypothetical protein
MQEISSKIAELTQDTDACKIKSLPAHYPSCIIFGVGLGYHIEMLLEDHDFDYIFICEPDFELFYASLYCCDWGRIVERVNNNNSSLFLLIDVSYDNFFPKLSSITEDVGAFSIVNSFCFQHYPSDEINRSIEAFFNNFYLLLLGFGFYNDAVTGLSHSIYNSRGKSFFLEKKQRFKLKEIPAFVVGNGPSLDESIKFIKENQKNAIIFAAGTAFQSLVKAGIQPDFHVLVERTRSVYQVVYESSDLDALAKTNLLSVDVVYPDTVDLYKWAGLALKGHEAGSAFLQLTYYLKNKKYLTSLVYPGPMVSNTAASFACELGFGEIFLFGVDNGYSLEDGKSHSVLSIYSDKKFAGRYGVHKDAIYKLEGNLGKPVMATALLSSSKTQLDSLFKHFSGIDAYKVGSGARLFGVTPLTNDDLLPLRKIKNKLDVVEDIKQHNFSKHTIAVSDEKLLAFGEFEKLINHLIEIAERPVTTRREASEGLRAQARLVYAYQRSIFPHLFHIVKGTLLYFHCPLLTLLYTYESQELSVEWFLQCNNIWIKFLEEIKEDYKKSWNKKCDYKLWINPASVGKAVVNELS